MGRRVLAVAVVAACGLLAASVSHASAPRSKYVRADEAAARDIGLQQGDLPATWKLQRSPAGLVIPFLVPCAGYHPDLHALTETGSSFSAATIAGHEVTPVKVAIEVFSTEA